MIRAIKFIILILFVGLILTNIHIFVNGIKSSVTMVQMEKELEKLRQENIDFESRLSQVNSLEYAASMAASFDFNKKAVPTYLENLKYALNR